VLSDSRNYASVVDTLRERKLSPYSVLDDCFQSLTLIHALFQVVFAVILVMGLWTFSNICGVILESRFRFIMKLRMLGIRSSHIAAVYAMIIGLVTVLAFVVVAILNRNFSAFIQEIATSLYPGVRSETVPVHYQFLAGAAASALILGRSIYRLVRRIETYDIIGVLEEK
jgi:predicted lysophospholipase L1 biosynthesis ABC-type transport system permease subunit